MSSRIIPNSFQTPNAHVDECMELLTGEEYKVLAFATRHILGWQDKLNTRRGRISLTMFEQGYMAGGVHYRGTGLSRPTIQKCCDVLAHCRLLNKIGDPTEDGQEWELGADPDLTSLYARQEIQAEQQRKAHEKRVATKAARNQVALNPESGEVVPEFTFDEVVNDVNQGVVNPVNQQGVNGVNHPQLTGLTGGGKAALPKQNHDQNHLQNHVVDVDARAREEVVRPNIYALYESNISSLNGMTKDLVNDLVKTYSEERVAEAIKIAVRQNVRKLSYIEGVLRNWQDNGPGAPAPPTRQRSNSQRAPRKNVPGQTGERSPGSNAPLRDLAGRPLQSTSVGLPADLLKPESEKKREGNNDAKQSS